MSIRALAVALVQQYCCHYNACRCCLLPYNIDGCKQTLQLRDIDRLAAYVCTGTYGEKASITLAFTQRFAARDDGGNSLYEPLYEEYIISTAFFSVQLDRNINTTNTDGSKHNRAAAAAVVAAQQVRDSPLKVYQLVLFFCCIVVVVVVVVASLSLPHPSSLLSLRRPGAQQQEVLRCLW